MSLMLRMALSVLPIANDGSWILEEAGATVYCNGDTFGGAAVFNCTGTGYGLISCPGDGLCGPCGPDGACSVDECCVVSPTCATPEEFDCTEAWWTLADDAGDVSCDSECSEKRCCTGGLNFENPTVLIVALVSLGLFFICTAARKPSGTNARDNETPPVSMI